MVVVRYPFNDLPISKPRPAVVLSEPAFAAAVGQTLVAMVTTASRSTWPHDTVISDLAHAGLKRPCVVRMRLATVINGLIAARIGSLVERDTLAVRAALSRVAAI